MNNFFWSPVRSLGTKHKFSLKKHPGQLPIYRKSVRDTKMTPQRYNQQNPHYRKPFKKKIARQKEHNEENLDFKRKLKDSNEITM